MRNQQGFTLLEMLITAAIGAVILVLAVPSFEWTIKRANVRDAVSEFTSAIRYARSEAITKSRRLQLCPSNAARDNCDDTSAAAVDNWAANGFILFNDDDGNNVVTAGTNEEIVRYFQSMDGVSVRINSTRAKMLVFNQEGFLDFGNAGGRTIFVCPIDLDTDHVRHVILNPTGRFRVRDEFGAGEQVCI